MRVDLKIYDVVMDTHMFLPQVTENKRTDPGHNQPASNFLTLPPYFHCLKVN